MSFNHYNDYIIKAQYIMRTLVYRTYRLLLDHPFPRGQVVANAAPKWVDNLGREQVILEGEVIYDESLWPPEEVEHGSIIQFNIKLNPAPIELRFKVDMSKSPEWGVTMQTRKGWILIDLFPGNAITEANKPLI